MNKFTFSTIAAVSALSLTACGGGGTTTDSRENSVGNGAAASVRFQELNDNFIKVDDDFGPQGTVPITGSANYTGQMGFDALFGVQQIDRTKPLPNADASVVGDLNLNVNFEPDSSGIRRVSGDVRNILYVDANNVSTTTDQLTVSGGLVPLRNSAGQVVIPDVLSADVTGQITFTKDSTPTTVDLDLDMAGQFAGTNGQVPEAVRGFVIGDFGKDLVGGTGGLTLTIPNGRFAATKN